jgi:hypothetical protein
MLLGSFKALTDNAELSAPWVDAPVPDTLLSSTATPCSPVLAHATSKGINTMLKMDLFIALPPVMT